MKLVRFLLLGVAVLAGLLAVLVAIAFTSSFQTWAARRALATQAEAQITVQRVSAGLRRVQVEQVQLEQPGLTLTLPAAEVEIGLLDAALHDQVNVTRLVAKGWTLDLTKPVAPGAEAPLPPTGTDAATTAATAVATAFRGVFDQIKLPVDLALDGVELDGEVIFPGAPGQPPGRAKVNLRGGQLLPNREGAFIFTAQVALSGPDAPVTSLNVRGNLVVAMDTPRTLTRVSMKVDAEAIGPSLPQGVQLTIDAAAARVAGGESYTLNVQSVGKRLIDLQANYPENSARLGGIWKLDLRDTDVAPFALGQRLPSFEAVGAGMFEADTQFTEIHAAGRLKSSADGLAIFVPELASVGALALFGEFDLTQRGDTTRVDKLILNVNRPDPVISVQSLQAFEFNPSTGELKIAAPAADLLAISLQGLPTRWLAPFVKDYALTGGQVRGDFTASANNGGLAVRSKTPLQVTGLAVAQGGKPLVTNLDVALTLAADYSPQGWQAELNDLNVTTAGTPLLTLSAKAGQLAGADHGTKATGHWTLALPVLLQQPITKDAAVLSRGTLRGEFSGSFGPAQEVQVALRLDDLAVPTGEPLPLISADARAAIAADGKISFTLPLVFENKAKTRRSDLTVAGSLVLDTAGIAIDAQLTSREAFIEDVQVLAVLAGGPAGAPTPTTPGVDEKPFWHGVSGQVALTLQKLHYNDQFEVSGVKGTVRIDAGQLKFDGVQAALGEGSAKVDGGLAFDGSLKTPYALTANLSVSDFDPAPFFRSLSPRDPATVEGKFNVTSKLTGRAANLAGLADTTQGDFQLTSKGGVFRGLPVNVAGKVETTGKIAAGVAAVGSFLGSVTGKEKAADIANKAQAVAEITKTLGAIPYDQLSVVLSRDQTLTTVLKDFTLISPELRLTGSGQAKPAAQATLLDSALAMEFKLRTRGHTADLFKYLGLLEAQPDELGYAACNLPLRISGTLGRPDTSEINSALASLALEKSGAGGLLNRWLGGGK